MFSRPPATNSVIIPRDRKSFVAACHRRLLSRRRGHGVLNTLDLIRRERVVRTVAREQQLRGGRPILLVLRERTGSLVALSHLLNGRSASCSPWHCSELGTQLSLRVVARNASMWSGNVGLLSLSPRRCRHGRAYRRSDRGDVQSHLIAYQPH